jgi:hypothetical protein
MPWQSADARLVYLRKFHWRVSLALGFDDEALGLLAALDDLHRQARHRVGGAAVEDRPRMGAVYEQLAQERKLPEQGAQQQHAAVTVLNIRPGDQHVQHETERVDEKMALLALNQLAAIEARRVDVGAPLYLAIADAEAVGEPFGGREPAAP